ncbi:hypothetical protein SK128_009610, partial [Halocaridina rubra]
KRMVLRSKGKTPKGALGGMLNPPSGGHKEKGKRTPKDVPRLQATYFFFIGAIF